MASIRVNEVRLYYTSVGEGEETILFSHGFLMNHTMFDAQIEALKEHFRCISYDHRSHGQSEVSQDGYELNNLTTDAIALIEGLKLGPVHFVGMSTGGFVGMRIALRRPDLLKSMILVDTSAEEESPETFKKNHLLLRLVKTLGWFPLIGQVMPILFHSTFLKDADRKSEVKKWKRIIQGHEIKGMVAFGKSIFSRESILDRLAELDLPTAVIVGDKDIATAPAYNRRIAEVVPNAEFYSIPEAGHSSPVEKPQEVLEAMLDFYAKRGLM